MCVSLSCLSSLMISFNYRVISIFKCEPQRLAGREFNEECMHIKPSVGTIARALQIRGETLAWKYTDHSNGSARNVTFCGPSHIIILCIEFRVHQSARTKFTCFSSFFLSRSLPVCKSAYNDERVYHRSVNVLSVKD